ncbi:hypothetical protein DPMN_180808 [Dreissena polymorpha]|uniref:Uncharacterized protein n=1 Tax=Dreissena polymorpha TaxID=45954 RepID=A0A9D4DCG4_DREPO|nr:hypothetical protein DPMN_180808 [Dreissena polymorpha]
MINIITTPIIYYFYNYFYYYYYYYFYYFYYYYYYYYYCFYQRAAPDSLPRQRQCPQPLYRAPVALFVAFNMSLNGEIHAFNVFLKTGEASL